jgi:membrane protein DedA with SNARE-associated domain
MSINILSFFQEHIYLVLFFIPFFGQLGIPSGSIFFLLFAGSLSTSYSELAILLMIWLISAVIGDLSGYFIGKKLFHISIIQDQLKKPKIKTLFDTTTVYFNKEGKFAIFLSRFLVVTPGPYINYIAWIQEFSFRSFVRLVIIWEVIYVAELLLLGYIFQDTFEYLVDMISYVSMILILIYCIYEMSRYLFKKPVTD